MGADCGCGGAPGCCGPLGASRNISSLVSKETPKQGTTQPAEKKEGSTEK